MNVAFFSSFNPKRFATSDNRKSKRWHITLVSTGEVGAPCGNTLRFTFSHSPKVFFRSTSISVQQIAVMALAIFCLVLTRGQATEISYQRTYHF
jgi:hypothetical protein